MKNEKNFMNAVRKGFTLVELLVVVAILGILATGATVYVSGYLDKANQTKALEQVNVFASGVTQYQINNRNRMPKALSDLLEEKDGEPAIIQGGEGVLEDPWGNNYELRFSGKKKFYVISAGPDGQFDTDDDIRNDKVATKKNQN